MKTRPIVWSTVVVFATAIHPFLAGAISQEKSKASTAEDYAQQGHKYFASKDYPRAIQAYKQAIAIGPTHQDANSRLVICYMSTDQWQPLIETLKKYQTVGELDPGFLVIMGHAHRV